MMPAATRSGATCTEDGDRIEARGCSAYGSPPPYENDAHVTVKEEEKDSPTTNTKPAPTQAEIQAEIESFLRPSHRRSFRRRISNEIRSLATIVLFLTRLPMPHSVDLHPGFLMQGMAYLPVIGTLLGVMAACVQEAVLAVLWLSTDGVTTTTTTTTDTTTTPTAAAPLVVVSLLASLATTCVGTGCFHQDGLADTADGFGGGWTRARILTIMTDSRVGTYGCVALVLYCMAYVALLLDTTTTTTTVAQRIVVAHTMSRVTAPYLIHCYDYVDDDDDATGPKSSFYAYMVQAKYIVSRSRVLFAFVWGGGVTLWIVQSESSSSYSNGGTVALFVLLAVLWFARQAGRYAHQVLGGVMGDFLGATICVTELFVLFLLRLVDSWGASRLWVPMTAWWHRFVPDMTLALQENSQSNNVRAVLENAATHTWVMFRTELCQDARVVAVLRCVAVLVGLQLWSTVVQYLNNSNDHGTTAAAQIRDPQQETSKSVSAKDDSAKDVLSRALQDPNSTFTDRYTAAQTYMDCLAKPVGSLGTLEAWACRLAALQRTATVDVSNVVGLIFAADHGAAAAPAAGGAGCSAYPQAVTRSVLMGLHAGVAGASVLARANQVELQVVDVGVILSEGDDAILADSATVRSDPDKLLRGTRNYCTETAMTEAECQRCMDMGRRNLIEVVQRTRSTVVVLGEVGIGNTTSSSALIAAITKASVAKVVGGGAFLTKEVSESVVAKKIAIVEKAVHFHYGKHWAKVDISGLDALSKLGGAEIAALVGAMLEASKRNIPVLVDGFIVTAASLVAICISPRVSRVLFFSSSSVEPGQRAALDFIREIAVTHHYPVDDVRPVLDMGLRMGEATAGLLAVPILRSSAAVLNKMATLQEVLAGGA